MNREAQIMKLVHENNGTITTAQITNANIPRGSLKYLVDKGVLERSARGVYILPELFDDEMYNIQIRYKKCIFSGETALYLHGLT
ncbi:MAG: type IV toxin-antitoxin system AbiEi family antitoxin domain-containing protein, partial [Bacillota bacterium]|nr:type IV toxin-antitoxin system AbiEi family antitoxin domain-containing protein [Bacillota bacterium]